MSLELKSINSFQMPYRGYVLITYLYHLLADKSIVALRPVMNLPQDVYDRIADIRNFLRGHVGLKLCELRFKEIREQRIKDGLAPEDAIPDRMINEFLRQGYLSIDYGYLSRLIDLLVRPIIHLKFFIWITLDH